MNKRLLIFFIAQFFILSKGFAQFTLTENFKSSTANGIVLGGSPSASLTSGGVDPVNQGYLRLTTDVGDQRGYAYIDKAFPSSLGVLMDFEYKTWHANNTDGADGIVVFLFDGAVTQSNFRLGGTGAGLGYAPRGDKSEAGLGGAYLGIGIDEYGNFSSNYGTVGGVSDRSAGSLGLTRRINSITLRGRESDAYRLLATTNPTGNSQIQYTTQVGSRPNDVAFYRRVQVEIKPNATGKYDIIVRWSTTAGGALTQQFSYTLVDQAGVSYTPPATLKLGFTSATGGSFNNHEIRNLTVTTPGNVRVGKRADKDVLRTISTGGANQVTYTVEVVNDNNVALNKIDFKDRITDANGTLVPLSSFNITSVTQSGFLAGTTVAKTGTSNEIVGSLNMAAGATGKIIVNGTLSAVPSGNTLRNTVTIDPTDITDLDPDNNVAVVNTPVLAENVDLTLAKTVNSSCLSTTGNDFSLVVSNVGSLPTNSGTKIVVTKTYPTSYTFTPLSNPNWTLGTRTTSGSNYVYTYTYNGATLASGASASPITYRIKVPTTVSSYVDEAQVSYLNSSNSNIEIAANQSNNVGSNAIATISAKPTVVGQVTYCLNSTATALSATPTNGNTLLWYRTKGGVSSVNAPVPTTNAAGNTSYFVTQTNGSCESDYAEIVVTVQAAVNAGTIASNQTICNGATPTALSSSAAGSGGTTGSTAAYRWEKSTDGGASWTPIVGATAATYAPTALTATTQFRRIYVATLNGVSCEAATGAVTITVQNITQPGSIGADQTICTGSVPAAFSSVANATGSTGATIAYKWESSTNGTAWTTINNATSATYTPTAALTVTTQYRRTATSTLNSVACSSVPSNVVTVTVNQAPTAANAGADIEQFNSGVFTLQGNVPTVGTGTWSVVSGTATISDPSDRNTTVTIAENATATLRWTVTNGPCAASADDVKITYTRRADLQITKTVDKTTPVVGDNVTFTLVAKNNGPSDASAVKVTDILKAGYTFVSSSSASYNASTGEWLVGTLQNGQSQTLTIIARVNANASTANYGNTATISGTETDPVTTNNTTSLSTVVPVPSIDIEVDKTATPKPAVAGQALSYTITLKNNGPSTTKATDVFDVTENLPAGYTANSYIASAGTFNPTTGNWSGLTLAAGSQATITISGTVAASAKGTLSNTVSIAVPSTVSDPNIGNNSKTDNTAVGRLVDLGVTKTSTPKPVIAGNNLTYTITLSNNGPTSLLAADVVKINENLPVGYTASTFTPSVGTFDKNTGNWTGLTLGQGQSATLTIVGQVATNAVGSLSNTVSVTAPTGTTDNNTANNSATESTAITREIDFEITKTAAPKPAVAGETLTYTISVSNKGISSMNASDVLKVVDALPNGFTASSYNVSEGTYNASTGNWNGLTLAKGQNATLTITGKVAASVRGNLTNEAVLTVPTGITDPVLTNNKATDVTAVVAKPVLAITKSGASGLIAGSTVEYTLKVVNTGSSDALNAAIEDAVPASVENVSWTATANGNATVVSGASGSSNAVSVRANIPAGNANNYINVTITGTLSPAATGSVNNTASVSPAEPQGAGSNSAVNANITSSSGIVISKAGASSAAAGDAVTYRIEVGNNGPSNATGVQIADNVPAGLTNVSWTSQAQGGATITNGASGNGNNINVTANIPAGAQHKIILNVTGTIRPDYTGAITNTAIATPQEAGSTPVSAEAVTNTNSKPVFTVVKNGPATIIAGNNINYTITVRNTGPSNSLNTVITDNIPSGITNVSWTSSVTDGTANITAGATGTGNALSLTGNFNANSTVQINVTGKVGSGMLGNIINSATVTPAEAGVVPVVSNEVNTSVTTKSGLRIAKNGPASVVSGTNITYTIEVENTGPSDALNATIEDLIPTEILNPTWTTALQGNAKVISGGTGSGNTLATVVNVPAGSTHKAVVTIIGKASPSFNGSVTNTATVTATEQNSPSPQSSVTTTINRIPTVSITKNGPSSVISGDNLTYSIDVINTSTSDAQNLQIKDLVSTEISGVNWTATSSGSATVNNPAAGTGNDITVIGNIPAGAANKITVNITGKVSPAYNGALGNSATATPAETGATPQTSTVSTDVKKIPVLAIEKTGPAAISAGQNITYTLKIKNNSTANADGASITDNVPAGIQNVTWAATTTGAATLSGATSGTGNTIGLVGNIPAGAGNEISVTINGTVNPSATANLINSAMVTPAETAAVAKTSNTITTQVNRVPSVSLIKTGPTTANAGETITYVINAVNAGPSNATNLAIADAIPAGLTNVTWTAIASGTSSVATASGTGNVAVNGNLNVGNNNKIQITVKGTIPANQLNTSLSNVATAVPSETGTTVNSNAVTTNVSNKSNISIVKSAPVSVNAGEIVNYTLLVKSTGPSNAVNATISDIVPADIQNVSWTAVANGAATVSFGATGSGNSVSIKANLPAGDANTVLVQITGKLNPAFSGNSISNTAAVTPSETGNPAVNSNTATTSVSKQADLRISKTGPSNLFAGEQATYTITVENQGPGDVVGAAISDILPASIINASWTVATQGTATASAANGTGNVGITASLKAGGTDKVIITLTGTVNPAYQNSSLTNTATATPPTGVTDPSPATAAVTTAIARKANLRIVKSGPANAKAGEEIEYTLKITNQGPSTAIGTRIIDNLPAGIMAGSITWTATATNGSSVSTASGAGNVNLTADIAPISGVIEVKIKALVSPALIDGTLIANTATATIGSGITDPEAANNTSTFNTVVDNDPNFTIAKSGPANANVGDEITYTILIKNTGAGNITDMFIADNVPDDVEVLNWTATVNGVAIIKSGYSSSGITNSILTVGDIPTGNNNILITVNGIIKQTAGSSFTNKAEATSGTVKESSVTTSVNRSTDIAVIKAGPQRVSAGENVTYTINVYNNGSVDIDDLVIADNVNTLLTNVSWVATTTGAATITTTPNGVGNMVQLTGNISGGQGNFITVTINGKVPANAVLGALTNTATVTLPSNITDYNTDNNTSSVSTDVVSTPTLVLQKTGPTTAAAGNQITYKIKVENTGPSDATGVNIADVLQAEITGVQWTASNSGTLATITGATSGSGNVAVNANIPAGSSITVDVKGTINPDFAGTIRNTATAKIGTNPMVSSPEVSTVVNKITNLTIVKSAPSSLSAGQPVVYTIEVGNNGPSNASAAVLTDNIPATILNPTWSTTVAGGAVVTANATGTGNTLSLTGNIPTGGKIYVTINGTLASSVIGNVSNTATITPAEPGNPPVVSTPAVTIVKQTPNLLLTKSAPTVSFGGSNITYTLKLSNSGPSDALGTILTDAVPGNVENVSWTGSTANGATIITGATGTGNNVSLSANIPANGSVDVVISGTINPLFKSVLVNTATAAPTEPGIQQSQSTASTTVTPSVDLVVSKSGPTNVSAGATINYQVVVKNNGPSTALNTVIADVVPPEIGNVQWTATTEGSAAILSAQQGTGNNVSVTANLPAGSTDRVIIDIEGTVSAAFNGNISNVASVTPAETGTAVNSTPVVTAVSRKPIIKITKGGPAVLRSGNKISYLINVVNEGTGDALNLAIVDVAPVALTNLSWQTESLGLATTSAPSGTGDINITANIPAGSGNGVNIYVSGEIPASFDGTILNTVAAQPSESDATSANSAVSTTVYRSSLTMVKTALNTVSKAGDIINYEFDIHNTGTSALTNLVIEDAGADAGSITPATIASLASGASVKVTASHTLTQTEVDQGSFTNTATTLAKAPDGSEVSDISGNTASDDLPTIVQITPNPGVALVKTVVGTVPNEAGKVLSYQLNVKNTGNVTLNNLVVTDVNAVVSGSPIAQLAPGANVVITASHVLTQADVDAGTYANSATVTASPAIGSNVTDKSGTDETNDTPTVVGITANGSMSLTKVANNTGTKAGDVIDYTIVVKNTGNVTLNTVEVADAGADAGTILPASIASLAPNATATVTAKHTLTQAEVDNGSFSNQAAVSGKDPMGTAISNPKSDDPNTPAVDDATKVTIVPNASMSLTKVANNTGTKAGDVIDYTIVVKNTGNVTLNTVEVADAGADAGTILPASIASLAPAATATVTAKHTLTQADIDSGSFSNQAAVSGKDPMGTAISNPKSDDPNTPAVDDATKVTIVPNASMSLTKVANNTGTKAGDVIDYTIVVKNTGNVTLNTVEVADAGADAGTILPASIASLAPAATATVTAKHTLTQAEVDNGSFSNQAAVSGKDPMGTTISNPKSDDPNTPAVDDATKVTIVPNASMSLTKVANNTGTKAGDVIDYTIVVKNTGNVTLNTVEVADAGADAGTILPASITSLAPNATATVTAKHTLTQADIDSGSFSNQAAVSGKDPVGTTISNPKSDDPNTPAVDDATKVTIVPNASMSLTKVANNTGTKAGDVIDYTIVVKNTGNVTLNTVEVADAGADAGTILPASIASLAPNATATVTAKHTLTQADIDSGSFSNQAAVSGKDPMGTAISNPKSDDPNTPAVDDATKVTIVPNASMSLTKVANNTGTKAGDVIDYTIVVKNTGNVTLNTVEVADAGADAGTILPASIASFAPNATATVTAKHTLTQADIDSGSFSNQAAVSGKDPVGTTISNPKSDDPNTPAVDDATKVTIVPNASMSLTKVANNTGTKAGDVIDYTIVVKNTGNVTLNTVEVADAGADAGTILPASIASLAPAATATVTAKHTLTQAEVDNGSFSNQAAVSSKDPMGTTISNPKSDDPNTPAVDDATKVTIVPNASMSLTKVANNTGTKAGDVIDYTIVVKNTGNVTLNTVEVADAGADAGTILPASIASLAPAATATVTAKHTLTQAEVDNGSFSNQAAVSGKDPMGAAISNPKSDDPNTPAVDDATKVTIVPNASMSLTKVANNTGTKAGDVIDYTIVVKNTGNVTLNTVEVADAGADAGTILPASIASLAPNATATVTAKHTLTQAEVDNGSFSNQAAVSGKDPMGTTISNPKSDDPNTPAVNDATIIAIKAQPAIAMVKTGVLSTDGNSIEYSFTVKNTGNVTLAAVTITDAKIGFNRTLAAPLTPGKSAVETVVYTLTQEDKNTGRVTNSAAVAGQTPDKQTVSDISGTAENNDTPTVTVIPEKGIITLVKTATFAGNQITYKFTIKNAGNVTLNTVELTDTKLGMANKAVTVAGGLLPGATVVVSEVYTLTQADKDLGSVSNTATVTAKNPSGATIQDVSGTDDGNSTPTVITVPKSPVANNDTAETNANAPVVIAVLDNDDSGNSTWDKLTIEIMEQPKHGQVKVNADGTVTYTPNPGYTGADSFGYRVKDAFGYYTNMATAAINANFFDIRVPNLFTPNGDGINDMFEIRGLNQYAENELTIVNRQGYEIFRQKNYQNNWTGEGLNEGTYYYLLRVKRSGSNGYEVFKGYITLVRTFKK
ncbi:DUF7507 domain-containing protein [Pedobacter endophyticus]|uniref:DUF11 domain-containing protein n=1 Tax=Pedobacter endophyticus TaxID=2789740 RepID=A0A7S9Q092_9SPHI|nr:gliding motility-associated C-terminal domain-containing protein [Pedobacter endophyticus]QPH40491.1 DUF11 domain-containing protein [Pedobacter endophyticus]